MLTSTIILGLNISLLYPLQINLRVVYWSQQTDRQSLSCSTVFNLSK